MRYTSRTPPSMLAPFVRSIWRFDGDLPEGRERILPSGSMQLLVNLHEDELRAYDANGEATIQHTRGAALCGIFAHPFAIDTREQKSIVGVTFHVGGAFPFFAAPASEAAGKHVPLDALWGTEGRVLRERLLDARTPDEQLATLERELVSRAVRPLSRDAAVDFAANAFDKGAGVGQVVSHLGTTPRRFIRRFSDVVGLTPKRFARIRRFQRALAALEAKNAVRWAQLSADCGYFDQAHLIRDFHEFAAMSPTTYAPRAPGERNHVPLDG